MIWVSHSEGLGVRRVTLLRVFCREWLLTPSKMRPRCRATFMDDWLKKTFDRLGRAIGEQPGYFLIVPILLSALCASGFQRVKFMADPEYLFRYTCQCIKIISLHIAM